MTNHYPVFDFLRRPNILFLANTPICGLWFALLDDCNVHLCSVANRIIAWASHPTVFTSSDLENLNSAFNMRQKIGDFRLHYCAPIHLPLSTKRGNKITAFSLRYRLCLLPVNIVAGIAQPLFRRTPKVSTGSVSPAGVMVSIKALT